MKIETVLKVSMYTFRVCSVVALLSLVVSPLLDLGYSFAIPSLYYLLALLATILFMGLDVSLDNSLSDLTITKPVPEIVYTVGQMVVYYEYKGKEIHPHSMYMLQKSGEYKVDVVRKIMYIPPYTQIINVFQQGDEAC